MPVFKNFADFEVVRGIRAFFNLEAGVVRGMPSGPIPLVPEAEQLPGPNGRPARSRQQPTDRSAASAHPGASGLEFSREDVPVFFLLGRQKSGTTWVMRLLNQHPEVLCRGEGKFFGRDVWDERLRDWMVQQDRDNLPGTVPPPGSLYNALANSEPLQLWLERSFWTRQGDAEEYLNRITRDIVTLVLTEKLSGAKRMVGDKTPIHSPEVIREIDAIFPAARIIHLIRDGRDVAVSQMHHIWNRARPVEEGGHLTPEEQSKRERYREDPEGFLESGESIFSEQRIRAAAEEWSSKVGATHRDGPAVFGDRYVETRYEALLERPEEEAERLFRFLGAQADEEVVERCVEEASFEKRAGGRTRGEEDSTSPVRKGIAGDWRNTFNERDKAIYKELAGDLLVELGYEKNNDW